MSYGFSNRSEQNLSTTHPELQRVFRAVGRRYNCSILCGHRGRAAQDAAYHDGRSSHQWPESKHNAEISDAIDAGPYPIDWQDMKRWYHFAGYVLATAAEMGIDLRWGGDWDGDMNFKDQNFHDLPHFEYLGPA